MKLRALVAFSGPDVGAPSPGEVFECAEHCAQGLISAGYAELASDLKSLEDVKAVPVRTPAAPKKPKTPKEG